MATAEVAEITSDDAAEGEVLDAVPLHVLKLGDAEFVCKDDAKIRSLFFRYADDVVRLYHEILVRAVDPSEINKAWDAFEDVTTDEATDALIALAMTYSESERPSKRPSPSRSGSRNTARKS
jgi:hypothetical protein